MKKKFLIILSIILFFVGLIPCYAKEIINEVNITGYEKPKLWQKYDDNLKKIKFDDKNYKVEDLKWSDKGDKFKLENKYELTFSLVANNDYEFSPNLIVNVNGKKIKSQPISINGEDYKEIWLMGNEGLEADFIVPEGIKLTLILFLTVGGILSISFIIYKILNHFFDLNKFESKINGPAKKKKEINKETVIINEMIKNKNYLELLKYEKSEFLDILMELDYSFLSKINRKELNDTQKILFYCMLLEDAVQADSIINLIEEEICYDELETISKAYKTVGAKKTSDLVNKLK